MRVLTILPLIAVAACTATSDAPEVTQATVRDADATTVANCQFLDTITQSQYSGMLFAGSGLQAAQGKVRNAAAGIGATHIVWGAMNSGGAIQSATGSAYRCG